MVIIEIQVLQIFRWDMVVYIGTSLLIDWIDNLASSICVK